MELGKIRIGIDIGGTNIELAAISDTAESNADVKHLHKAYPYGAVCEELCIFLRNSIDELLRSIDESYEAVASVGIAMPGALDLVQGRILHAYNLNLHNTEIIGSMKALLPNTVFTLINDADAAALGELKFGALRGIKNGCLITLGTGVGSGLIINGNIYQGGMKRGSEFGHMTLKLHGKACTCGNTGCVETECSGTALALAASNAFCEAVTAKELIDRAKHGDKTALKVFDEYTESLSSAIASYAALLDPERVVIGGGVSLAGELLFNAIKAKAAQKCFFNPICDIVPAMLHDKAGAIGAAFAPTHMS